MSHCFMKVHLHIWATAFVASLAFAGLSFAQGGTNPNFVPSQEQKQEQNQQLEQRQLENKPAAPKVDPQEEVAYKAFYDTKPQDADTRITLGQAFVQKYPTSHYAESVYAGLTQAYYTKQDWKDFYASGDKALALNPDDAPVLVVVGWVIPHALNPSDPDASSNLDKAERYEKHAIEVVGAMQKPASVTDDQFAQTKASLLSQAHSALGLVYFRRQDSDDSVKELQQATQSSATPDPTDLFVLGLGLQSLNRYAEAADAFNRCGQIPSSLQDRCKQSADAAKKQAR
jgi:tetratricopeptide (TPR) repeat protein